MNRNKAKEAYPNRPNAEISAILGEQWRTMSVAEKRKYKELAMTKKKVGFYHNYVFSFIF